MANANGIQDRLWQTELDFMQARYRTRLSHSLKHFINGNDTPGELVFKNAAGLDPEIQGKLLSVHNQIFKK